ncbi:MAG: glycoside hydrolase family 2 [Verrucomicrobia bacterium]|nr:MAG: glycoside hydrolase family 2 [Verrucomicrobiota bacterium]
MLALPRCSLGQETQRQYLSGHGKDDAVPWKFFCTTGALSGFWTNLPVPSNWDVQGFGHLTYKKDYTNALTERGLYEHEFSVPSSWLDRRVFLVFEGAMTDTSAKLNGESVGPVHQGSFYRFKYDVTPFLKFDGTNKLEIEVAKHSANESVNKAERLADYWVFGGIFRPVYLEAVPAQYIERVAIDARADGDFKMDVFLRSVKDADVVEAQITTLDGQKVGEKFGAPASAGPNRLKAELQTKIGSPKTWTAETPNLYRVEVRLKRGNEVLHQITQQFGFRTFEVRDGDGLYLNGRKIILKGVNRHSFWPDSGRCLSDAVHRLDIETIKAMNGNAVRMSHYPPDAEFLDLCDELGLYVLDELAGWHNYYDTPTGTRLVEAMVARDVNHPSILLWDNGNEGGFNTNLDKVFGQFDPQQRRVLHPWAPFSGVNTAHYLVYSNAMIAASGAAMYYHGGEKSEFVSRNLPQNLIYMPTEFMHALYDGGGGAGLEDYWNVMMSSSNCAGGFIWALTDDGVKRPDTGEIDTAGNQAPDGIVGPYREREGSFYAIKDIWSPISVAPDASGALMVTNRYSFRDANECGFKWQLRKYPTPSQTNSGFAVVAEGKAKTGSIPPGRSGPLKLVLPTVWTNADALAIQITDPVGRELWTASWPMSAATRAFGFSHAGSPPQPVVSSEGGHSFELKSGDIAVTISKDTGLLLKVARGEQIYSLGTGPRLAAGGLALLNIEQKQTASGATVAATYSGDLNSVTWRLLSNGWLRCDYKFTASGAQDCFGVVFNLPEDGVKSKRWLGDGPYRVWKNRLRGVTLGVWENEFNDTITGYRDWKYPEFKGCFANVRWLQLETTEGLITVVPENIPYVQVLTPGQPPDDLVAKTKVNLPKCGLGFLHAIPPIGTKFKEAGGGGPQGQPNVGQGEYSGSVSFYFGKLP